jgi:beta-glucuronidase
VLAVLAALSGPAFAQTGGGGAPPSTTPTTPAPPPPLKVQKPTNKRLIREGQPNRLLLGGTWYFRQDDALQGLPQRFFAQRSLTGWSVTTVPNDWNATDTTLDAQGVGWYRKEFKLPGASARLRWIVRFESVNNRATVWLNGKQIGTGGPSFLPFELDLKGLRKGRNRLVVRVSSRRSRTDLTHWRPFGGGGWWNWGGISREVYVRPVDTVDIQDLAVIPRLRCARCPSRVEVHVVVRNLSRTRQRVALALLLRGMGKTAQQLQLAPRHVGGGSTREIVTSLVIRKPRLWQPGRPNLYSLTATAATGGVRRSSFLRFFGVRKIQRLPDGEVLLNGRKLQLRGASIHEDDPTTGSALTPAQRSAIVRNLRSLHASFVRSHYPLHPALLEAFDRYGIMDWTDAPVYQLPNAYLDLPSVRRAALSVVRRMVLRDRSHPSQLAWSLGNELASTSTAPANADNVGSGFARYVQDGAREVRKLDKTRLVALDRDSRIGSPTYSPAFNTLDALGINEYFGWYRSAPVTRGPARIDELGPFLDAVHAAHPSTALFITEFGAEASGHGPATARGTYEFQSNFLRDQLAVQDSRSYLNGSLIWILKDFRVVPGWTGGNDPARAVPPWNEKGLIEENGARKPAFYLVRDNFRHTKPLR